jgi:DnaK suppressor protein
MRTEEKDLDTSGEIDSEEAMAAEEMQEIQAMLLSQMKEIEERLNATNEKTEFEVGDEVDHSVISQEQTLNSLIVSREIERLQQIKDALQRMDSGEYGWCEETGQWIGKKRLMALPFSRLSLEAQMEQERRVNRNRGVGGFSEDTNYAGNYRD